MDKAGDGQGAAAERAAADAIFNYTRNLQSRLTNDLEAGIEDSDVFDRQDDLIYSYYLEGNVQQVLTLAGQMSQSASVGDIRWMMGKNYRGMGLQSQSPPDLPGAAAEFDGVLDTGFTGRADHDRQVLVAADWRDYVAHRMGDNTKIAALVQWVQSSNCHRNQKTAFLNKYSSLLPQQNTSAK
jgi:hypothetical protein